MNLREIQWFAKRPLLWLSMVCQYQEIISMDDKLSNGIFQYKKIPIISKVFLFFVNGLWDFPWNKPSRNWGSSMWKLPWFVNGVSEVSEVIMIQQVKPSIVGDESLVKSHLKSTNLCWFYPIFMPETSMFLLLKSRCSIHKIAMFFHHVSPNSPTIFPPFSHRFPTIFPGCCAPIKIRHGVPTAPRRSKEVMTFCAACCAAGLSCAKIWRIQGWDSSSE